MKILRVTASMDPASGGVAGSIVQMAISAIDLGHQVEVVTMDDPQADFLHQHKILIHALGKGFLNYKFQPQLVSWLKNNARNYDAIIIDGIWQFHSVATRFALKQMALPYFVFTHGMLAPWFKDTHPIKHLKKLIYWPLGDYKVLRDAKAVVFTCEEERLGARKSFSLYSANEKVLGLGVSHPEINSESAKIKFFEKFPEIKGKRIILCLCRIHLIKGLDILIRGFAEQMKNDPEFHLVIAGPGEQAYLSQLKNLTKSLCLENRVTWTGMLLGDMKSGAYSACEAFTLISHHENFSLVVAEALSFGKPVLISNKVNIWLEIIADNAGFSADDNLQGAVNLFKEYAKLSREEYDVMALNAQRCFSARFEAKQATIKLLELLG